MKTGGEQLKMPRSLYYLVLALCLTVLVGGCVTVESLKEAKPIIPQKEYEKMLLGNLSADYIGNENCLKSCHTHDKLATDFRASTMGDQLAASSSGMMVVNCESCHGPGSEAIDAMKGLTVEKNYEQIVKIHKENFLDFKTLPAGAKSLICLKCHTQNATFNIHNWNVGVHALNEVSCSDCHPIHTGSDLVTPPRKINELCIGCHRTVGVEFSLPSHHPVKENKIYCTDCHQPHGTTNDKLLVGLSIRETCARCHTEKAGPYLYEHADLMEECTTCHAQHGSINDNLLKLRGPFLCKQCHPHHRNSKAYTDGSFDSAVLADAYRQYLRCTDCHTEIHGTDTPSVGNSGGALTR